MREADREGGLNAFSKERRFETTGDTKKTGTFEKPNKN